jgi:hypothetical protein
MFNHLSNLKTYPRIHIGKQLFSSHVWQKEAHSSTV